MKTRAVVVVSCAEHGFDVLLADMINRGLHVTSSRSRAEANRICIAWEQRARAMPLLLEVTS